jgi:hypothetical protein
MANKTRLISVEIEVAENGYVVKAEYDTDEVTKDPWDRRVTEKHIARDLYGLWHETAQKIFEEHEQRVAEARAAAANTGE